jgi:3-hydroxyethyl bacteriochlorophyllide a dehydrogenase
VETVAVVLNKPERLQLRGVALTPMGGDDVAVEIEWSGISTGTERLFWNGRMPAFPGMGYPLVPGYESVGRVVAAGANVEDRLGEYVFVPGATCYTDARGLFGGASRTLITPASRALRIQERLGARGVLMALAATAHHAIAAGAAPDLIIGHGVLGRLLARIAIASGAQPTVWETDASRGEGAWGYPVLDPNADERGDYANIYDASGDAALLDQLVSRLKRGGEIVLAGFYEDRLSFAFAPAFMREARLRIAAEWKREDLDAVQTMLRFGRLSLDELVTHKYDYQDAEDAYAGAFTDRTHLKTVLDWSACA